VHDGEMYELAEYIIPHPLQQGSNVIHHPYFTHGPNKQRPFLLIEVHITDGRTVYVLLSQVFRQEDREA